MVQIGVALHIYYPWCETDLKIRSNPNLAGVAVAYWAAIAGFDYMNGVRHGDCRGCLWLESDIRVGSCRHLKPHV